jgi:hypothetical protein
MQASFSRRIRYCLPAKLEQITQKKMKHSDDGRTMVACYIRPPETVLGGSLSMKYYSGVDDPGWWLKGNCEGAASAAQAKREKWLDKADRTVTQWT